MRRMSLWMSCWKKTASFLSRWTSWNYQHYLPHWHTAERSEARNNKCLKIAFKRWKISPGTAWCCILISSVGANCTRKIVFSRRRGAKHHHLRGCSVSKEEIFLISFCSLSLPHTHKTLPPSLSESLPFFSKSGFLVHCPDFQHMLSTEVSWMRGVSPFC